MISTSKTIFTTSNNINTIANYNIGDSIFIDIDGEPIEFIVINQGNPNNNIYDKSCDGTWLIMKNIYSSDFCNDKTFHNNVPTDYPFCHTQQSVLIIFPPK